MYRAHSEEEEKKLKQEFDTLPRDEALMQAWSRWSGIHEKSFWLGNSLLLKIWEMALAEYATMEELQPLRGVYFTILMKDIILFRF